MASFFATGGIWFWLIALKISLATVLVDGIVVVVVVVVVEELPSNLGTASSSGVSVELGSGSVGSGIN